MIMKSAAVFSGDKFNASALASHLYDYVRTNRALGLGVRLEMSTALAEDAVEARQWVVGLTTSLDEVPESEETVVFTADECDELEARIAGLAARTGCKCAGCRDFFNTMGELGRVASIARDFTLRRLSLEQAGLELDAEGGTVEEPWNDTAPDWLSGMAAQLKEAGLDVVLVGFEIPEPAPAATPSGEFWSVGVYRTRTVETAPKIYRVEGEVMSFGDAAALLPDGYALPYFSASQREAMQRAADLQKYLDAHPQQGPLGAGTVRLSARMFAGELPPTFGRS